MYCVKCGAEIPQGYKFCRNCGQAAGTVEYVNVPSEPLIKYVVPPENTPISAWGYVGLDILFAIPAVGIIAAIILSFNRNINIRNLAQSFWCALLLVVIIVIVIGVVGATTGATDEIMRFLEALGIVEMG